MNGKLLCLDFYLRLSLGGFWVRVWGFVDEKGVWDNMVDGEGFSGVGWFFLVIGFLIEWESKGGGRRVWIVYLVMGYRKGWRMGLMNRGGGKIFILLNFR